MKTYVHKKPEYTEIENVEELCRLCLEKVTEGVPIFKNEQDVCAAIAMRIMGCVGLEMQQDSQLPNHICQPCHEKLEKYYKFRKKCEVSYQKLKYHLLAVKCAKHDTVKKVVTKEILPVEYVEKRQIDVEIVDEEERHIDVQIVDEEERDYEKKLVIQMEPEGAENVAEKVVEMEEMSQEGAEPDISAFLSGVLLELGVLHEVEGGLLLQDISSCELETGSGEQLVLELVEEDDEVEDSKCGVNVDVEIKQEPASLLVERSTDSIKAKPKQDKTPVRPWCVVCGRLFSSRSALARHARVHSGARPHACAQCGATFSQRAVLHRHMLVHLDVRPHRCTQCDKSFTQRGALAAHARTHAAAHERHMRLHSCTVCDKVFLYASGLSRHMFQHTGRSYACADCGKQFNDKSSLLRHRKNFYHGHKKHRNLASKADKNDYKTNTKIASRTISDSGDKTVDNEDMTSINKGSSKNEPNIVSKKINIAPKNRENDNSAINDIDHNIVPVPYNANENNNVDANNLCANINVQDIDSENVIYETVTDNIESSDAITENTQGNTYVVTVYDSDKVISKEINVSTH